MTTRRTRFGLEFFAHSQNIDFPESFILPFLTRKVSTVTFSEGGCTLSRSQNNKTSNIWYLVSATSTFSLKLVVEWRRLPRFPAKMRLVHARALTTKYWGNLVLVVVLVLESIKGSLYFSFKLCSHFTGRLWRPHENHTGEGFCSRLRTVISARFL